VDAIFGTGLCRDVTGPYAAMIDAINGGGAHVVAVDVPSGMAADSGVALGVAVRAHHTVTFGRLKPGLLTARGRQLSGVVTVADIGLGIADGAAVAEVPDAGDLSWPRRPADARKTTSGHLAIVAGHEAMAGAGILACAGALAAGAGLVTLIVPAGAHYRLGGLPAAVMVRTAGRGPVLEPMPGLFERATAIVAGPGLGGGNALTPSLITWLEALWAEEERPVLFDADALPSAGRAAAGHRVITPHVGEAARLLGSTPETVEADRFSAASRLANPAVAVLKGPFTLVAAPGERTSVNPTGCDVLATAGSGDVLAGVIGALLACGETPRDAAILGAWVHGHAADLLARERRVGWAAHDIADAIPLAIAELHARTTSGTTLP
jgi:NAD(P)H-hydrate epimerase